MKKLLALFTLTMLLFAACQDNNNPVEPSATTMDNSATITNPNWIAMAPNAQLGVEQDFSTSKLVKGSEETLLEINAGYPGGIHYYTSITANLRFQRNSFVGERFVTMTVNDEYGKGTFSPSGTFLKPAIYNITLVGLDLTGVNPNNVKFVYMATDGKYYQTNYQSLYVNVNEGKIQLINAQLPHFSRYGFVQ
jgi:hypothetical protein